MGLEADPRPSLHALVWGTITRGNICVAGDAFHQMTLELAQGGCAALEHDIVFA
jgi:2-polyprenyl-6-methoxyphenol hydroxylase-like FAD-dependent oxidoreductase